MQILIKAEVDLKASVENLVRKLEASELLVVELRGLQLPIQLTMDDFKLGGKIIGSTFTDIQVFTK